MIKVYFQASSILASYNLDLPKAMSSDIDIYVDIEHPLLARMVLLPITFLSISNRFLEALFYGKPIVTTIYAKYLHPELIHGQHIYISNNIVQDVKKLLKLEEVLKSLEQGAKEAYTMFFSTKHNLKVLRSILTLK